MTVYYCECHDQKIADMVIEELKKDKAVEGVFLLKATSTIYYSVDDQKIFTDVERVYPNNFLKN